MSRVFLDTNILVYSVDNNEPAKRDRCRDLIRSLGGENAGVVSTQVLQEFYVVATRKLSVEPLTARRAMHLLPNFEVVTITVPLIELAIDINVADQLSFWDALIVAAATSAGCDEIWTEDLQHGRTLRGVRVADPLRSPA